MCIHKIIKTSLFLYLMSFPCAPYCSVVLQMTIEEGSAATHQIDVVLFDESTPLTVSNFLNYVNGGAYLDSFVHRSLSGFIIQGGGFTFDPTLNDGSFSYNVGLDQFNGGLQAISTAPPVINEFELSNARGTLSMAKLGADPDSATSQWFVNLDDNSEILDNQNSGFTVFGKVLGTGMTNIDQLAAVPLADISSVHPEFTNLPLNNYDSANTPLSQISKNHLLHISNISSTLQFTSVVNVGEAISGSTVMSDVIIENIGIGDISIGAINDATISAPYSISKILCENTTITSTNSCVIQVTFSPLSNDYFADSFVLNFTNPAHSFDILLTTPAPDISPNHELLDFGFQPVYNPNDGLPEQIVLLLKNKGDRDLIISSVTLTGLNQSEFTFVDNCTTFSPILPSAQCVIPVNFLPDSPGIKNATITIVSNDPDNLTLVIPVMGSSDTDVDGVDSSIENASPNSGDANFDGILDSLQSYAASLTSNGKYITIVVPVIANLREVKPLTIDVQAPLDANESFELGLYSLVISDIAPGAPIELGYILPENLTVSRYMQYGVTPDNTEPHWYDFTFDPDSNLGAKILGIATLNAPDGSTAIRNVMQVSYIDGGIGDDDLTVDGKITISGGIATKINANSSGSHTFYFLLLTIFVLSTTRKFNNTWCM